MSDLLANIYLIDFDVEIKAAAQALAGIISDTLMI